QTLIGTIATISEEVKRRNLMPPAIVVVGEVVKLREQINWYETLPLFGKKILVTRARTQASELSQQLTELGAEVLEIPTIEIVSSPDSWKQLDRAIDRLKDYQWILFTSANGAEFFLRRLEELKKDVRALAGLRLAAVGPSTAQVLRDFHLQAD